MRIRLTDADLKKIVKELTIICDTREKKNHVTEYFDKKKIKYINRKLDAGDYSIMIPKGTILQQEIIFDKDVVVERKKDIDELASNFSKSDYPRLEKEFQTLKANGTRCLIIVEDYLFDKHLRNHTYRSKYEPLTLKKRLAGFEAQFDVVIRPTQKDFTGSEIYYYLESFVKNYLKRNLNIEFDLDEV